ncbi:aminotransferase class V-fold PLP-dependent enzyme [Alisedimentitalea sp. MJ-SS2]|uniref:aminotransferase class V-fold PLP-dependent enzyme n=1 Tax=Aliisedimentitalea sp. MJ-SS2 TaxID=3049795 RepID=UPI00291235FD|nr:aminotransferase class V-fold PLP-dependent enzyme [Alisedimentitalea sp. MJ-SS2]MDU8928201.1 aminotransferase class V-fold PLP-dependent enzyme [Alisedimentitalea sp. MJ-SS2]
MDIERIRAETPGVAHSVHLLAAGSSLMPQVVVDAIVDHTRLEAEIGGYEAHARQSEMLDGVYDSVARHIGASAHEIALLENATVAWMHAFYALPLKPGSRILTCEAEYAANYVAFLQRAKRDGLKIEVVPSDATGALDVDALAATMGDDVGLIAITWVPTNGGLVNPAAEVGRIARAHGVPYLLDACQAVGQMRVDVDELGCDFLSATGRKFLRGPRGTGFLYVREKWLASLEPAMIDFFGAPWVEADRYELRPDARRFETWENAYALRAGLGAAMDYANKLGIDAIEARIRHLAGMCRTELVKVDGVQLRDLGTNPCGIVSFSVEGRDPGAVVSELGRAGFVIGTSLPSSTRLDAERRDLPVLLRMAPHYYNTDAEIEGCVARLAEFVQR